MASNDVFRIPLTVTPQRFGLELGGRPFIIETKWNAERPAWEFDMFDGNTETHLVGVPLVTNGDLLSQHRHLELGGKLVVVTDGDSLEPPTLFNLGAEANLYFVVD